MREAIVAILFCAVELCAQTCTVLAPSNCGTAGMYGGPPTLQSFVTGVSTALPKALANVAASPQPRIVYSGEVVAASQTFMTADPHSCPISGTCLYNNPNMINNWIDSLVNPPPHGVGLKSVDLNLWVGPLFQSREYNPSSVMTGGLNYCGAYGMCYGVSDPYSGWHANGLFTYDQVFAHLATKSWVKVRIAPMLSEDVLTTCGIHPVTSGFTEAQIEQCALPLWTAMVKRWHVDDDTVIHEPCGILAAVLATSGCAMSVSDLDTFIQHAASAVRATSQNSSVRIGAGALNSEATGSCPGSQNYWCDWYTNLASVLDFFGMDIYPNTANPSANYNNTLANFSAMAASVVAIGKPVVVNEASGMRWAPQVAGAGEAGTYWGCAASEWYTDGTQQAWSRAVPGGWAAAQGVSIFSIFPTEYLMLLSSDTANNHCITGVDGFLANLSAALSNGTLVSPAGKEYAVLAAGWNASLQGRAHLTGRAHIGH